MNRLAKPNAFMSGEIVNNTRGRRANSICDFQSRSPRKVVKRIHNELQHRQQLPTGIPFKDSLLFSFGSDLYAYRVERTLQGRGKDTASVRPEENENVTGLGSVLNGLPT